MDDFIPCFIGTAGCCDDGQWYCPNGMNPLDCADHDLDPGLVCEGPPPDDDCCVPDEAPDCVEGPPTCCFGGFFLCPEDGMLCAPGISCEDEEL
jgi:hypothetical protein